MLCRAVCGVLLVAVIFSSSFNVNGRLLNTLEDMIAMVNEPTAFSCSSDVPEDIHWDHIVDNNVNYVFAGGEIIGQYKNRFQMKKNITAQSRTYTLVIPNVRPGDAGVYLCRDDLGRGDMMSSANLIVLNSPLTCTSNMHPDGFIGKNTCNLQEENMTFSCSASFNGKAPPLKWRSSKDHQPNSSINCRNHTNQFICDLTLRADPEFDGLTLICEVAMSSKVRYNCSTNVIKVQYLALEHELKPREKAINDEAICSVKSSRNPRFTWTYSHNNEETMVSNSRSHVIPKTGGYWCNVSYDIRGVACSSLVSVVHAHNHEGYRASMPLAASFGFVALISVSVSIGLFVYYKKRFSAVESAQVALEKSLYQLPKETVIYKEKPELLRTIITKASQDDLKLPVYGVTILKDELFVVSKNNTIIEVYSLSESNNRRDISVAGLSNPRNIITSTCENFLYIENLKEEFEKKSSEIFKIDRTGIVVKKWPTGNIGRISTGHDSNVIATLWDGSKLLEYNGDGKLIREIKISKNANIRSLRQAMPGKFDHFVLIHGDADSEKQHRVCVIGSQGQFIKAFGDTPGILRNQVKLPSHFAIDKDGSIIVADRKNQRILLLNHQLELKRELLTDRDVLKSPWRVCLDMERGYLIVADNRFEETFDKAEGRILIYSIIHK